MRFTELDYRGCLQPKRLDYRIVLTVTALKNNKAAKDL